MIAAPLDDRGAHIRGVLLLHGIAPDHPFRPPFGRNLDRLRCPACGSLHIRREQYLPGGTRVSAMRCDACEDLRS